MKGGNGQTKGSEGVKARMNGKGKEVKEGKEGRKKRNREKNEDEWNKRRKGEKKR